MWKLCGETSPSPRSILSLNDRMTTSIHSWALDALQRAVTMRARHVLKQLFAQATESKHFAHPHCASEWPHSSANYRDESQCCRTWSNRCVWTSGSFMRLDLMTFWYFFEESFTDKSDKWSKAWCRTLYRLLTLQELEYGVARNLGSCRWMSQAGASQRLYNPKLPVVARPRVMQELFGASALLPLARRLSVQVGCAKGSKHVKQERSSVLRFFLCSFCLFRLVHLFVFRYGHMVLPQKQSCRKQTWIRTWRLEISTCTRFTENVLKIECKSCPNALVRCKNNISQVAVATYGTVELPLISVLAGLLSEEV